MPWVLTPPLHKLQHNNPLMKVRRVGDDRGRANLVRMEFGRPGLGEGVEIMASRREH